ncbi:MAG: DNA topoisomerase IV subunit A, partial [Thermoproteota archaeon]
MKKESKAWRNIVGFAVQILKQVERREPPSVEIPLRTVDNIVFDEKKGHYVLGPKKALRTSRNVKHLKPLTQLVWVTSVARKLIDEDKTSTLRDVFYMAEGVDLGFEDQSESDRIITEL